MIRARKTLSAVAAAALLSTSALLGISATTFAAPSAQAQATNQIPATADLAIHKRIGAETGTNADGTVIENVPGTPAPGIDFSVFPVLNAAGEPIDLTTTAGWNEAAALTAEGEQPSVAPFFDGATTYPNVIETGLGAEITATTGEDGTAVFADLPASVYLVVEHNNQSFEGQALAPSVPFLATVPMTNPEGTGWLSTVNVYPKNQTLGQATKTIYDPVTEDSAGEVDLTGASLGELIGYTVESPVPTFGGDTQLNAFNVTDRLPAELGAAEGVTVTAGGETLVEGTDYTVSTWSVPGAVAGTEHQVLLVELTPARLAQLTPDSTVTVDFQAPLIAVPESGLENIAWSSLSDPDYGEGDDPADAAFNAGTASNSARSIYGEINILKTGVGGAPLSGATFELHRCDAEGNIVGLPIQVGGESTWTTEGEDGAQTIAGIHLANAYPTTVEPSYVDLWAGTGTQFCLEEIDAPEGYSLLPEPVMVDLVYDFEDTYVPVDQQVVNVETNAGFTLPLTGGLGIWLIIGAGVLLLVTAGGYYVVRKRSTNA